MTTEVQLTRTSNRIAAVQSVYPWHVQGIRKCDDCVNSRIGNIPLRQERSKDERGLVKVRATRGSPLEGHEARGSDDGRDLTALLAAGENSRSRCGAGDSPFELFCGLCKINVTVTEASDCHQPDF